MRAARPPHPPALQPKSFLRNDRTATAPYGAVRACSTPPAAVLLVCRYPPHYRSSDALTAVARGGGYATVADVA